jgi:hypothetical protein
MVEQAQTLDLEQLTTDELLDHLIQVRQAIATLKAEDASLLTRLDELAAAGEVDHGGFKHAGWSFGWSAGKCSYAYPEDIEELEADLTAAKEAAKADGSATADIGEPFWTIKPPKKP